MGKGSNSNDPFSGSGSVYQPGSTPPTYLTGESFYPNQGTDLLNSLLGAFQSLPGNMSSVQNSLNSLVMNPQGSALFQSQVGPLLQSLQPSAQLAQQNLTDAFRQAGNMSSGAFANQNVKLQSEIYNRDAQAVGGLLNSLYPQLLNTVGLERQMALDPVAALTQALNSVHQIQRTYGFPTAGRTSGSSGGISDPSGFLNTFNNPTSGNAVTGGQGGFGTGPTFGQVPYGDRSPFGTGTPSVINPQNNYGSTNPGALYDHFGNPLPGTAANPYGNNVDPAVQQLVNALKGGNSGGVIGGGYGNGIMYDPSSGFYTSSPDPGISWNQAISDPSIWAGFGDVF